MADVDYQLPMQLLEALGLRGWEASQPRVYWGLRRPDGLPDNWSSPNAGLGGGAGWGGYQGGYGVSSGGGGGYGTATGVGGGVPLASFFAAPRASVADVGGAGVGGPESGPGVGMNAQAASFGDFLGSLTSPIGAFTSFAGQALANGLAGRPSTPITNLSLSSLLGAARNAISGGSDASGAAPPDFGSAQVNAGANIAGGDYVGAALDIAGSSPNVAADAGYQGGGYDGGPQGAPDAGYAGDHSGAEYATGGPVTLDRLIGPNPPGPDDGFAALDAGEHVLTAAEVRALGGHAGVMRLRELLRR